MRINTKLSNKKIAKSISVGDLVTSEFYDHDAHVKRTVTRVEHDVSTETTVRIWADDGGVCPCCNRPLSKSIDGVDGAWFIPVQ